MKEITKFVAWDGSEFSTRYDCCIYERLYMEIRTVMSRLKRAPESGTETFVQQEKEVFLGVQHDLVVIFERLHPLMTDQHTKWARDATRPAGFTLVGRYMDDCGPGILNSAWRRIMCVDHIFREWGQPYYAHQADSKAGAP
jgi:hypothetical protein